MKVSRNDPCPCGSGLKHKRCCAIANESESVASGMFLTIIGWVVTGGVVLVGIVFAQTIISREDAPVQQERVWSDEHGHWHNVSGGSANEGSGGGAAEPNRSTDRDNPPSAGAVWSEEHGHWHGGTETAGATAGRVWSEEHGHWHGNDAPELEAPLAPRSVRNSPLEDRLSAELDVARDSAGN